MVSSFVAKRFDLKFCHVMRLDVIRGSRRYLEVAGPMQMGGSNDKNWV